MSEKLIFPIGFDLEEGVKEASKEWKSTYQKQLQKAIDDKPLKVKIDFESKGIDTKEFKQWMVLAREAEKLERERIKNAKEWQKVADQQAMAETRRANATNESNARIERQNRKAEASERRKRDAVERTNEAYKRQGGYLQRLFQRMVAYASVTQAFSFIRNIREVTAQFELQRVALGSIIGDLNEANTMFEQIKAAAVKSPFQIKELVTYTKQLAAYKIESDELFETTQRLADISAGLGVGMERLVLAYGQIRATGYLRASEVRQLTEAGIPIVEELAKKMSELRGETVSAAEVMGLISERAISFGMVKEVFDDMTSAGGMFYKMQEKQAETLAGQWSNLQDAISIMYEEIGNTEGVNNSIKGTIGLVKSLAENWRDVYSVVQSLSVAMGVYYVAMKNAAVASKALSVAETTRLSTLRATTIYMPKFLASTKLAITLTRAYRVAVIKSATATGLLSKAFWGLTKAMLSNPYTAVLAALAGLATLLLTTESRAKRLSKELAKIGEDGAIQIDQSARNFERLAKAIRESEDGSEKQTAALAELKRSYGELLPEQDKEIKALVQEKANYDSLIKSIKRKIELQIQEQKINKIASEYGSRISTAEDDFKGLLTQYGLTEEDADRVTIATKKAIDEGLISAQKSAQENARELSRILEEETGLTKLKDYFDPMVVFTERYGRKMRSQFGSLVEVVSEYNTEIDKVGEALDKLDDKGKKLSDTFNTWQKELANITEGKNLKGEGIRLFDDESITQINKLTDATARVAEEYDKLAKEKKEVDKVLKSEGAKADKDTYAKLQERLGKINEGMSGLYDFLKKYGALDLIKSDDKTQKSAEQALKDELAAVEKIYKRYQDLRKLKSETDTQSILAKEFKGVNLTTLSKAYSPEQMLEVYQKALAEAQRLGKKDLVLEIQTKIGEFNIAEEQRKLEKSLKDLSDKISRTKTAKEFFDRMLGMTGDKQLSATLTMSVYGTTGDDLQKLMSKQILDAFKGVDISEAMLSGNKWDYNVLAGFVEQLPEAQQKNAQSIVDNWRKANADILTDLQKSYEDFMTYEERKTRVAEKYVAERKKIEESQYTKDEKDKLLRASREAEKKELGAIAIEEFKASDDWIKSFEDLENLATPTIERLMTKLKEFITLNNEALTPEQLKSLMGEYDKLYNGLITRNPIQAITDSIKEYKLAIANIQDIQRQLDFARELGNDNLIAQFERDLTDAFDDAQKATSKLQKGLSGLGDKFSQAQQFVSSFTDTLGVSEDTQFGAFLNGISDALGGVSKAFAFAQLAVQIFDGSIKTMLASNPIGWILLAVSAIISAVQAIANARVKRIDQDIERIEDRLDSLSYAYDRLQKAQEKAFGNDYINNYERQLENLEAQQEAYLKQAELERSKGKKADEDKIKEYENQARDTADAIKDMYGSLSEQFLGSDLTSAARDFANAWIDAYKEFSNTTDAMKAKLQDMIQNMVVESLLAKVMEKALEPVFTMIDEMQEGDFYSTSFWQRVMSTMQMATENGVVGAQNVMAMLEQMGINLRGLGGEMTGISRDIATASEESILGLAAGINTQNFYISQVPTKLDTIIGLLRGDGAIPQGSTITLQDVMIAQNQFLSHLPTIAQHTAETVAECKQIVAETRRTADALERVIKPDGTRTTYKMNVVTTYQG
jgi:hypothetical protein